MSTRLSLRAYIKVSSKLSLDQLSAKVCEVLFSTQAVKTTLNGDVEAYTMGASILGIKLHILGHNGDYSINISTKAELLSKIEYKYLSQVYIDDYLIQLLAGTDGIESVSKP